MNHLIALDRAAFHFFNQDIVNGLFDRLFPVITNGRFWIAPAILGGLFYWRSQKTRVLLILLLAIALVGVTDLLTERLIKPFFHRLRPCDPRAGLDSVRCLIGIRRSWSFPSSHAVNSFALVSFFALLYPRRWVILIGLGIAGLVSFSRVYVGVHYPADIAFGALLGSALGLGLARALRRRVFARKEADAC